MLRDLVVMETMAKSPFILDLHDAGFWSNPDSGSEPYLLVELSTDGNLAEFLDIRLIRENGDLLTYVNSSYAGHGYSTRKQLVLDIASGLLALHEHGIFHTDIKPDNILIFGSDNSTYRAKISDFGSSVVRNRAAPNGVCTFGRDALGTAGYTAPELAGLSASEVLGLSNSELRKLDVFSFAVLLLESLSSCRVRGHPFDKAITIDLAQPLSFIREYTGTLEWDKVIVVVFHRCLQAAPSRCDDFVEILNILQEGGNDLHAGTQASTPLDGNIGYSQYLTFLDRLNDLIGRENLNGTDSGDQGLDIDWLLTARCWKRDRHCR
jgi:serine/threonine protein kinase